jgi:hypothetical protein
MITDLVRAPCDGGNETGLNAIVPVSQLSPFQQWFVNDVNAPGRIQNIVQEEDETPQCLGVSLAEDHWSRASAPSKPSESGKSIYVSVQHHPDSCMACQKTSAGEYAPVLI